MEYVWEASNAVKARGAEVEFGREVLVCRGNFDCFSGQSLGHGEESLCVGFSIAIFDLVLLSMSLLSLSS